MVLLDLGPLVSPGMESSILTRQQLGPVLVLESGQVLDVQQHGVLLGPQLVPVQQLGHQLCAQRWKGNIRAVISVFLLVH